MLAAPKMTSAQSEKEAQLANAIVYSQSGVYSSLRQTALATGVVRSTLGHRLAGRPSRAQTHLRSSRLTAEQEEVLTRFIEDVQRFRAKIAVLRLPVGALFEQQPHHRLRQVYAAGFEPEAVNLGQESSVGRSVQKKLDNILVGLSTDRIV